MPTNSALATLTWELFNQLQGSWVGRGRWGVLRTFNRKEEGFCIIKSKALLPFTIVKFVAPTVAMLMYMTRVLLLFTFGPQALKQPGGLLHKLQFYSDQTANKALKAAGIHYCARDVYKAHYLFTNPQQFQLTYQVTGPRKDYTMETTFHKEVKPVQ